MQPMKSIKLSGGISVSTNKQRKAKEKRRKKEKKEDKKSEGI